MMLNNFFNKKTSDNSSQAFLVSDPKTPFSVVESYKTLRTNIMFSLSVSEGGKNTVVINSPNPSEGKSTVAVNLSIALSDAGNKTLIIDGDLRKPVIHSRLNLPNENGLSSYLGGFKSKEDIIKHYSAFLDVITAGESVPNPSELLSSKTMKNLLAQLEQVYDYIIIDTPPSNVVTDAIALAPLVSGMIVVVKENETSYPDLDRLLSQMEFSSIKVFGVVVNAGINKKKYGKYGKYGKYSKYGGYSKYGSEDGARK